MFTPLSAVLRTVTLCLAGGSLALAARAAMPETTLPAGEVAAILAGLQPEPAALGEEARAHVRRYAKAVGEQWKGYEKRIGEPMRDWACSELAAVTGKTVFYPFAGADFASVQQFYPHASRFVLVALQRAGAPPALAQYSPDALRQYLATYRSQWRFFAGNGFFRTIDLDDVSQRDENRLEVTALLMGYAARLGYEVQSVQPMRIGAEDLVPDTAERRGAWGSVRLTLKQGGRRILLDYVRLDLSDGGLKDRSTQAWVENMAQHPTMLKAASHLLQKPYFSTLRNAILGRAPSVLQDETGLEYSTMAATFNVTLYGKFTQPNHVFSQDWQRALAAAYANSGQVKPMPFKVGYEKESGSALLLGLRGTPAAAERSCPPPRRGVVAQRNAG